MKERKYHIILQSLLARLASGEVILGDGSYVMTLEKMGYATAGQWTPEAAAEHPQAVEQLAVEFARAGADITQTFTFWCHEDALPKGCKFSVSITFFYNNTDIFST